jgi:pyrroloquinoline quinone biosynthesis protein B
VKILVLGSAAGGGFPQWNCNCRNCAGFRSGAVRAEARTQSSIAVSGRDPASWVLVNASPDIRAQLEAHPVLQPARAARDTAIAAVVLADAQIDHTTGLYLLRESGRPWPIYCTDRVYADLTQIHPVFAILAAYCGVERYPIPLNPRDAGTTADAGRGRSGRSGRSDESSKSDDQGFAVPGAEGVHWRAIPVESKPPPFSPRRSAPMPGDNVAFVLRDERTGRSAVYAPGLGEIDAAVWNAMLAADCVLVDGTFWTDDEMIGVGVSSKRARDIGHLPQSGPGGMLEHLGELPAAVRKILIHINNTNPILDEDSPERAELAARGIEVARDGMEIEL